MLRSGESKVGTVEAAEAALLAGRYEEALENFKRALDSCRASGDRRAEAFCLRGLGDVAMMQERLTDAELQYLAAKALYEEVGALLGCANTVRSLADLERLTGRLTDALAGYRAANEVYRANGVVLGEAKSRHGMGTVEAAMERSGNAATHYAAALVLFREVGDRRGEGNVLLSAAGIAGESVGAIELCQEALGLFEAIDDERGRANALLSLGEAQLRSGQARPGLETLGKALAIYQALRSAIGQADALLAIGDGVLQYTSRPEACRELYGRALALHHSVGHGVGERNSRQRLDVAANVLRGLPTEGGSRGAAK